MIQRDALAVVGATGTALVDRLQPEAVLDALGVVAAVVGYVLVGRPRGPILFFVVRASASLARGAPLRRGPALSAGLWTRLGEKGSRRCSWHGPPSSSPSPRWPGR